MRMLIGLILFWISTFGYLFIFKKKTKIPYELLLPILFSLIGIIIFLAGIFNMLKEFSVLICFGGIFFFAYNFLKKEINFNEIKSTKFILLMFLFSYITIICSNMHLLNFDNFTHWGLIVKNMFLRNSLPNFETTVIGYTTYQPGSACFIYYLGFSLGKTEASMIIAQNYLVLAYLSSVFVFFKQSLFDKKKNIMYLLFILLYIFILFINIMMYDLLVDTLIGVMLIASFAVLYYFRNDLKKAFIYNLPILVFLFLVKNIGIVLVAFSCLGLVYIGYRNKEFKKGFLYALLSGIISVAVFYIWTKHVTYVFGEISLYSRHTLSFKNIINELHRKGLEQILEFCTIYYNNFVNIRDNLPNKYMIVINLILIFSMIIYKNKRKNIMYLLLVTNIIYLVYYIILGLMYLLSMPWEEAIYIAGFNRYMLTIIIAIIGLIFICFVNHIMTEEKFSKQSMLVIGVSIISIIFLSYNYGKIDFKVLMGDINYEKSIAYKYDNILNNNMFSANNDRYYYIYAPDTYSKEGGYLYFMSKYKLNTSNFMIVKNIDDFNTEEIDENLVKTIIVFDEDEKIKDYIKNNNYKNVDNFYIEENYSN